MNPDSHPNRISLVTTLLVALLALAVLATLAGERDLFDADEGRYAAVARAMSESGDWVVPRLDDMPFLDKPPLVYWIQAALLEVLPPSALVARAPTLLAGAIWVALLFLFTLRLTGSRGQSVTVAALAATSAGAILGSRVGPQMDMPLAACVTGALYAAFVGASRCARGGTGPGTGPSVALGIAVGLGLLTKGPLVVAVPLVVAGAWIVAGVDWRAIGRTAFAPLAWLVALIVAVPWYVAIERAQPGWIRHFIAYEHFGRFGTGDHRGFAPFWFYVPVALAYLVPWSHLGWGRPPEGARLGRRLLCPLLECPWSPLPWRRAFDRSLAIGRGERDVPAGRIAFGWFLAAFLLYSVSTRKLLNYLLPAAAPLMMLAGVHLFVAAGAARAHAARFPWIVGLGMIAAGIGLVFGLWHPLSTGQLPSAIETPRYQALAWAAVFAGLVLATGAWFAKRAGSRAATIALLVGAATGFWWLLDLGFASSPGLGSSRELAEVLEREARPGDRVVSFKRFPQGLAYYSHLPVWIAGGAPSTGAGGGLDLPQREIVNPYATRYWIDQPRDAAGVPIATGRGGLLTDAELRAVWDGRERVLLVCRWAEVQGFGGRIVSGPHAGAGRTDLYVVVNE